MIWFDIGMIMILACILALAARKFKQPLIPAYIIAGIIIGPSLLGLIKNSEVIMAFSEFGIAFLLFFAGLEMSVKKIKEIGKAATINGLLQVLIVGLISFLLLLFFSFKKTELIFLALAIPFSSTAIVVKLLSDKRKLNTLHARIAIGMLLVQDIIAIVALTILSSKIFAPETMLMPLLKVLAIALFAFLLSKIIINRIFEFSAKSTEMLSLSAIALCFLFALLSVLPFLGMPSISVVIGAFIAGVMLANSPFKTEIEGSVKGLRDFFVVLFFVSIGMQLVFSEIEKIIFPSIALMAVVLFVEPYITMALTRIAGYTKRTSFLSGFYQAQTSEFSLILVMQGMLLGHVSSAAFSMIVLITIITMSATPFIIESEDFFYQKTSKVLNIFERLPKKEKLGYETRRKKSILLLGCHRMGSVLFKAFKKQAGEIIVIDLDPDVIKGLMNKKIACIYGDVTNKEILEKINFSDLKILISTIPEKEENEFLINYAKERGKTLIFVNADNIKEALSLYEAGASYVFIPQIAAGEESLAVLKRFKRANAEKIKKQHVAYLKSLQILK